MSLTYSPVSNQPTQVHHFTAGCVLSRISIFLCTTILSTALFAQTTYTWNNVRMIAGGFITGIVYHPNAQNLVYTRTDIGGLYRSTNGGNTWVPLLDWVNWSNWGYSGVLSVATDPNNGGTVYAAVGRLYQFLGPE